MEELAAEVVVKGYALIGYGAAAIGPGVGIGSISTNWFRLILLGIGVRNDYKFRNFFSRS